jgi:hypothetical protein
MDDKKKIEFSVETFTHGENEVLVTVSTSKTAAPRVTISVGRKPRFEDQLPSKYLPFEQLDDVIAVLTALKESSHAEHARNMAAIREKLYASRKTNDRPMGGNGNSKMAKKAARRTRDWEETPKTSKASEKARRENAEMTDRLMGR